MKLSVHVNKEGRSIPSNLTHDISWRHSAKTYAVIRLPPKGGNSPHYSARSFSLRIVHTFSGVIAMSICRTSGQRCAHLAATTNTISLDLRLPTRKDGENYVSQCACAMWRGYGTSRSRLIPALTCVSHGSLFKEM